MRQFADPMLETLAEERVWCDEQPSVADLRSMLEDHEPEDVWRSLLIPAEGEDRRTFQIIAEATAEARGIALHQLPALFLVSRTNLRRWACLSDEIWEDPTDDEGDQCTVGWPASRIAILLGQDVEDDSSEEQSWLNATFA